MPRAQIGVQTNGEGRLLDAFVKLKKMRMAPPNSYPDYFDYSLWRKRSDTFDRKKECAKFYFIKFLTQHKLGFLRDVGKKAQGEVKLIGCGPANPTNLRIKIEQSLPDGFRRIDRYEKST